jgi:hypothetical protein
MAPAGHSVDMEHGGKRLPFTRALPDGLASAVLALPGLGVALAQRPTATRLSPSRSCWSLMAPEGS